MGTGIDLPFIESHPSRGFLPIFPIFPIFDESHDGMIPSARALQITKQHRGAACPVERDRQATALANVILDFAVLAEGEPVVVARGHIQCGARVRLARGSGPLEVSLVDPRNEYLAGRRQCQRVEAMPGLETVIVYRPRLRERPAAVGRPGESNLSGIGLVELACPTDQDDASIGNRDLGPPLPVRIDALGTRRRSDGRREAHPSILRRRDVDVSFVDECKPERPGPIEVGSRKG